MIRSFRFHLALQAAAAVAVGMLAVASITFLSLRSILDRELNASIMDVASVQAASLVDGPSGEMHFHEWELTPDEASSLRDLMRYAEVWRADGVSLLRSRYMTRDLPLNLNHLATASTGHLVWAQADWDGIPIRTLYYPLQRFGVAHEHHVLQVAAPLTSRNAMLARVGRFLSILVVLITVGTFLGGWWLAGRAVRPVHEIIDQAESIRSPSLGRRIRAYGEVHEYRRLVDVLNGMLGRIQDAFDAQRRFTADASHELRSPLTVMRGELELALRRPRSTEAYQAVLESTLEEVVRLSRITENLLALARSDSGSMRVHLEQVHVSALVSGMAERLRPRAEEKWVALHVYAGPDLVARVDGSLLGRVAWNLIENAIKFTPAGGEVEVFLRARAGALVLDVRDTGPGFRDPAQAFRPFYRDDFARTHGTPTDGTGLGLAIVQAAVRAHGGRVSARNLPGAGARVTVRLPVEWAGSGPEQEPGVLEEPSIVGSA